MATFKLALDAGHGLPTPGRRCLKSLDPDEHQEWWLNQRVCNYIAEAATQYEGFQTLRVDDVTGKEDVPMSERCKKANNWGADLYYSAHHNAGINGGRGGGIVAFSLTEGSRASTWRDALYAVLVGSTGLIGNRANPKTTENFYVLRNTSMPAVLIEHGFMDSPSDVPVILRESFAKAVGYAVADCIADKKDLDKKQTSQKPPEPSDGLYRVRLSWDNPKSQIGAYRVLENAKAACKPGYSVYDSNGNVVYTAPREYTVVDGDTLWGLATRFLGDGNRYLEIVQANGLKGAVIYPGQKLIIPGR